MVLGVLRPEMAMDFGSKEVESMLDGGGGGGGVGAIHGQLTYRYGAVKKSGLMFGLKIYPCVLLACYWWK